MAQVLAVFGAGSGLGLAVARLYGKLGWRIALLARNEERLAALVDVLAAEGIDAMALPLDLARLQDIPTAVAQVRARFGRIDAIYHSPNTTVVFAPANALTIEGQRQELETLYFSLIAVIREVLPEFRRRGGGMILSAFGGSAAVARPFFSGSGPGSAAARNYLQSLHGELLPESILVGLITIRGTIRDSGYHRSLNTNKHEASPLPLVDPALLADLLYKVANDPATFESAWP